MAHQLALCRDAQIEEKKHMMEEEEEEDRALDLAMEVDRLRALEVTGPADGVLP